MFGCWTEATRRSKDLKEQQERDDFGAAGRGESTMEMGTLPVFLGQASAASSTPPGQGMIHEPALCPAVDVRLNLASPAVWVSPDAWDDTANSRHRVHRAA